MTRREKERNEGLKEVHGTVDKQSRAVDKLHLYNSFEDNWRHGTNSIGS